MSPVTNPATPASPTAGWGWRIWQRLRFQTPLKAVGTTAFMYLFFRAYFELLESPRTIATVMPQIWLDDWVQFTPSAFPVYLSLWVYVSLAPALLGNLRALIGFGFWVAALCLTGLAIFWAWPTQTPTFNMDWSLYPGLALIKGVDAAGNAFPSLHVASAVFSACWLQRSLRELHSPAWVRWASALHCVAIAWSTMATLQHVALDVLGGTVLGLVFAAASLAHIRDTAPTPLSPARP